MTDSTTYSSFYMHLTHRYKITPNSHSVNAIMWFASIFCSKNFCKINILFIVNNKNVVYIVLQLKSNILQAACSMRHGLTVSHLRAFKANGRAFSPHKTHISAPLGTESSPTAFPFLRPDGVFPTPAPLEPLPNNTGLRRPWHRPSFIDGFNYWGDIPHRYTF